MCFNTPLAAQQAAGGLRGKVLDGFGAVVVGAQVTVTNGRGKAQSVNSNDQGTYDIGPLEAGRYTLSVLAEGFSPYKNGEVEVPDGERLLLDVTLEVTLAEQQEVTVTAGSNINTEPDNNADALVLREKELAALPDDPDELAAALQALAGPAAGPSGGDISVDGFAGSRLPPKRSIREVRINQNPFSAEYDQLGTRNIEVFTKPGTEKFTGEAFFNFNDESLNTRNPFASNRAPYQSRLYGGNFSGPIIANRASFFLDFERRDIDDNAVVNATVLDSNLRISPFSLAVLTPQRQTVFSPRVEYTLSPSHTLVGRYTYTGISQESAGVGVLSLPSRAFDTVSSEHNLQLTETSLYRNKIINETRFQYVRASTSFESDNTAPTLNVLDAFVGGGSQLGSSSNSTSRWLLQNYTSWAAGNHGLKVGARLRRVSIQDLSFQNFGGTQTFAGGLAPQLDEQNRIVTDSAGQPVLVSVTSIERYRRTLLFQREGLTPLAIRALGGGAAQFSITDGNPEARVSQTDVGVFFQDDWRVRPNFTLSLGLRYETQNNISSLNNFAPRIRFAWSPGASGKRQSSTVIRGGAGIFYNRFGESLTLRARRFDGDEQRQFVISDTDTLDRFDGIPSPDALQAFALPPTIWRVAHDLRTPYFIQTAIGVDRQLSGFKLSATFINVRGLHLLRARNINAPLPGLNLPGEMEGGIRPLGATGDLFQYESSGILNQRQLILNFNNNYNKHLTFMTAYVLGSVRGDTDGPNSFPSNSYDTSADYGRSSGDVRHRFFFLGSIGIPWQLSLNPFVIASSSRPFNIITGRDSNGDGLFTERPAFATDLTKPGVVVNRFGAFDPNPAPGQQIIPRNFGEGPGFFIVNLQLSKAFTWHLKSSPDRNYGLTCAVQVLNLLNHTNAASPIGNLGSALFGQSNASAGNFNFEGQGNPAAGNRRVELQMRFSF